MLIQRSSQLLQLIVGTKGGISYRNEPDQSRQGDYRFLIVKKMIGEIIVTGKATTQALENLDDETLNDELDIDHTTWIWDHR